MGINGKRQQNHRQMLSKLVTGETPSRRNPHSKPCTWDVQTHPALRASPWPSLDSFQQLQVLLMFGWVSRSSLRDRDFLVTVSFTSSSFSSFLSSDHLILLLSCWPCFGVACLICFLLLFLLLSELIYTSSISSCRVGSGSVSGWFSSSAIVPVAGFGVATVTVTFPSDPEVFSPL